MAIQAMTLITATLGASYNTMQYITNILQYSIKNY